MALPVLQNVLDSCMWCVCGVSVMCAVCGVWRVVRGVWCVVVGRGSWVVCGVCGMCGVCGVWCVVCGEREEGWRGEAGLLCCWYNAPGPFALGIHCTVADSMCPSLDDVVSADRT